MRASPLSAADAELLAAARSARAAAYAPYSGFHVGAALRARDGRIFAGCNVENASYSLSNCAERTALFCAVAAGAREFEAIAIAGPGGVATPPCGACRQALIEFGAGVRVLVDDGAAEPRELTLGELLPLHFDRSALS